MPSDADHERPWLGAKGALEDAFKKACTWSLT
jgi:hypothetical protein